MEIVVLVLLVLILILLVITIITILLVGSVVVQIMEVLRNLPEEIRNPNHTKKDGPPDRPWYTYF